ncbi:MAG: crossover junction endodeoxyribonuclease RuvC [Parcubacteria group bacterium Gr01-1014_18]|nr:MAG: crossover junction endodeoxyribonuclease RuvC [Parcubacteria group bacterium Greene0416_36]TSC81161.1 MAG: crossover junction endodeoxyribonuclease RuvC [Parcubacteria group bacterium Gr01-1014_18]TSC99158.1 MAG: crossover junction endodeoxyribonuclease RuvC [Parcubacteria group bacterium Greene1014_20]TSD07484.1 MAG: crossover junction endodeoxyribonuclease RuvC [Parcubacteria group bacterium Greene0714_2]
MGIDPGLANTGFGVIEYTGNQYTLLEYGCIETDPRQDFSLRLSEIHTGLNLCLAKWQPDRVSVEDLFFCKNVKSAILVGQARGVCILSASLQSVPVFEYTPLEIKQSVCGYGRGSKDQVGAMVKILLGAKEIPSPNHAADALAAAICCANDSTLGHL